MTGYLTHAAAGEHISELHAAAGSRHRALRERRPKHLLTLLPGLRRPRRALAA